MKIGIRSFVQFARSKEPLLTAQMIVERGLVQKYCHYTSHAVLGNKLSIPIPPTPLLLPSLLPVNRARLPVSLQSEQPTPSEGVFVGEGG